MGGLADEDRIRRFMRVLGREADEETSAYFTGGATAMDPRSFPARVEAAFAAR